MADLTTSEGRAALVDGVTRLTAGKIDAIVSNAGGGPPQTSLQLNFFGAVAALEGLRPLLKDSPAPRAWRFPRSPRLVRSIQTSSKSV